MNGLWKENVSNWNTKDQKRKKQTRKNTLRDKSRAILQDLYKNQNAITQIENAQTLTYSGSRWGGNFHFPEFADVYEIGFRIPKKDDEYNDLKSIYVNIKAYYKGTTYNGQWLELETNKSIRDYFGLNFIQAHLITTKEITIIKKIDEKRLDWTKELIERKITKTVNFTHSNTNEFAYNKPLPKYLKWTMYTESSRRKWAHKYVQGQTRTSVRNWINKRDWNSERKIPWGEVSYAWIID